MDSTNFLIAAGSICRTTFFYRLATCDLSPSTLSPSPTTATACGAPAHRLALPKYACGSLSTPEYNNQTIAPV